MVFDGDGKIIFKNKSSFGEADAMLFEICLGLRNVPFKGDEGSFRMYILYVHQFSRQEIIERLAIDKASRFILLAVRSRSFALLRMTILNFTERSPLRAHPWRGDTAPRMGHPFLSLHMGYGRNAMPTRCS